VTIVGPAAGEIAAANGSLAVIVKAVDGSSHLAFAGQLDGSVALLTTDPLYRESAPSFSPDGKVVVFARTGAQTPDVSAGIWTVNSDGTGLTNLATDGSSPRWVP
jgi:dipeptidyl aminopeptidase/acylaminoacyl peptidase